MADQNIKVKIDLDVADFNKHAKDLSDAISKVLGKDVDIFNGKIRQTAKNVDQASAAMGRAGMAAGKASSAVKQSNQQWTSLALVIQDLPFGFRGIQNNLPALAGSLAGVAGPAYLAFSALVAAITAYDMGLFGATKTTDEFAKSLKETNNEIRNSVNYSNSQVSTLQSLVNISTNLNNSEGTRKKALQEIKEILGQVNKEEADKIANTGQAILAVNLYTEALKAQQLQEATGKRISELQMQLIEKRFLLEKKRSVTKREFNLLQAFLGYPDLQSLESDVINAEALIRQLESLNEGATKATLINPFSKANKPQATGSVDLDKTNLENLKKQQKYYKDDFNLFYYYGGLIIQEEKRLAVERATIEKKSEGEINRIIEGFRLDMLINQQEHGRAIMADAEKNTKDLEKQEKEGRDKIIDNVKDFYDNKRKYAFDDLDLQKSVANQELAAYKFLLGLKVISDADYAKKSAEIYKELGVIKNKQEEELYKSQVYFSDKRIKNIESTLGIQLKLNRNNIVGQQEAIKDAMAETAILAATALNPTALQKFLDLFDELQGKLKGTKQQWESFSQSISSSISGFLADSLTSLAENIGNALSGGELKPLEHFQMLLADALINIGKMLIQFGTLTTIAFSQPNPFVAIAAGVGAVALGTMIKNRFKQPAVDAKAFANGGIVSGPTMGLVGEYPGAQNNPEVIAPLDKLKDLIGGGGNGQFVLRGQDLVLAMQRSNTSLNIRRG